MKNARYFLPLLLIACNSIETDLKTEDTKKNPFPIPTQIFENMADEKAYEERRDAYFDLIHSSSENVDWRAINALNFQKLAEQRAALKGYRIVETFADGNLEGEWKERGSVDVPGSNRICDYDLNTDDIYVISDGGTLWKGNLNGETWTPLNDDIQFGRDILKVVSLPGGGVRIITANGYSLRYSDDQGDTWTNCSGIVGSNGSGIKMVQLNDAQQTLVYLYNRISVVDGYSLNKVAFSTDHGLTFYPLTDLSSGNRFASIHAAHNSPAAYILDNNDAVYKFEAGVYSTVSAGLGLDGTSRCMIQANEAGGMLTLYILMDNSTLYKSTDSGVTFDLVGDLATGSWDVGFRVSIDDPDKLYYGEVNTYRSFDGGETWDLVSEWWEYYGDVANKIHADIMAIEPFKTNTGDEFTIIPNHGGVYVSYDNLITTENISMQDLNTGQFYDVLTDPYDASLIYGGTQDQGFQRTLTGDSPLPSSFQQVISGDYGEMQFTNNGQEIWIQYPGAWFQLYPNAATDGTYTYEFDLAGEDMPNVNWIVPTGAAPNISDNFIYVGGGSLDGGPGSYLVKLKYTGSEIVASQYDFDFRAASGASISAIETTPLNDQLIYVVTENGRFFYSLDGGESFTMTEDYIGPSGGWIYTADIYASRTTPGLVFVGGSGYAGNAVYMSVDSAKTFVPLTGDMPNTMAHELTMDPAEKFLFAATDAGPYVYSMDLEEWYNMSGISAPLQQYISCEFIPSTHTVRFATWGRGIWDFNLTSLAGTSSYLAAKNSFSVYPNPVKGNQLTIQSEEIGVISLYTINGKLISSENVNKTSQTFNVAELPNGIYLLELISKKGIRSTEKFVIQR
jgi:hypothetical protein